MKQMLKLGLILAVYAAAACVLLALVNNVTAPVIAQAKAAQETAGLSVCFPLPTDSFEAAPGYTPQTSGSIIVDNLYLAYKDGAVIGAVARATGPTYDEATILLGIDMERTLTGIHFLSITDTPGFGQRATEPAFYEQFSGKSADDPFEPGADVDMITGATISTRGIAQLVKYAAYVAGSYLAEHCGAPAGSAQAPEIAQAPAVFSYEQACRSIFPDASFTEITDGSGETAEGFTIEKQYLAADANGAVIGALAAVRGPAYSGTGVTMTGVTADGIIAGVRIIELNDTPGIGQRALEESFYGQFAGKPAHSIIITGGAAATDADSGATAADTTDADTGATAASADAAAADAASIDIISGATITSQRIADMAAAGAQAAAALAGQHTAAITGSGL